MPTENPERIRARLADLKRVAVLGIHPEQSRAAYYVPAYLHDVGVAVFGVNPHFAGEVMFGHPVRPSLDALDEPVDLVNIFRRSDHVPAHVPEILRMQPLPATVWMQLGIRHDPAAATLEQAGIAVVQDRCLMVLHRNLLGA